MPLVAVLATAARWLLKYMITKAMVMLGIGYVSFTGIDALFTTIENEIWNSYNSLPGDIWSLVTLCGFDVYISVVLSAFSAYMVIKGLQAGVRSVFRLSPLG